MIDAIFLDIDGTLLGSSARVEEPVWHAAERARARGVKLIVCTGRCDGGVARQIAQRLDPDLPHIFEAGALVVQHHAPLLTELLDPDVIIPQVQLARRLDLTLELYSPAGIFVDQHTERGLRHTRALQIQSVERDLLDVITQHPVVRLHWICAPERVEELLSYAPQGCVMAPAQSEALPGDAFISVTRQGVNKGSAVRFVAQHLGLDLARCAAIGDSFGDLAMLEAVAHPRVMAAAPEALRSRFINVPDVEHHGARDAIDDLLKL